MVKVLPEIAKNVTQLPRQQRLALARFLLDLDDSGANKEVEAVWDQEVQARIKAFDDGLVEAVPYEDVKKEWDSRFA